MPTTYTSFGNAVVSAGEDARYDNQSKFLLKYKSVIAIVAHYTIDEFRKYSPDYIMRNCFVDDIWFRAVPVDPESPTPTDDAGNPFDEHVIMMDGNVRIVGDDTEDATVNEGEARFDVVTKLLVPGQDERVMIIVHIDEQIKISAAYDAARSIFYATRLTGRQKNTVFKKTDYANMAKVHSIWLYPDPGAEGANSLATYAFRPVLKEGNPPDYDDLIDKIYITFVWFNDDGVDSDFPFIRFMSTLMSKTLSAEEKFDVLENDYHIQIHDNLKKEVRQMGSMGAAIARSTDNRINALYARLAAEGRMDDAVRTFRDEDYRMRLYETYYGEDLLTGRKVTVDESLS